MSETVTNNKVLTITIPAYNAQMYLKKCVGSLLAAGEREKLEIIIIDDGSTDETGIMADAFAARYPETVRVVHKENGGHGSGVNRGIREARGRFFKVVDADDWVDPRAFKKLMDFLDTAECDAVVNGFYWNFDNGKGNQKEYPKKAEIREPFRGVVYGKTYRFDEIAEKVYIKMHGLTIRTAILQEHDIQLDENCFYVDAEYILYPIPYLETIVFLKDFVYQYRIGRSGQSVSAEKMQKNEENYDRVLRSLFQFYKKCRAGKIICSKSKMDYLAGGIARIAAGKMKIILSFPPEKKRKRQLVQFNQMLKSKWPEIYEANKSRPVGLLRMSRFHLYGAASRLLRLQNRRK